ncbi:lysostaphin resistance A-like protein [Clostridium sp. LBM24168]
MSKLTKKNLIIIIILTLAILIYWYVFIKISNYNNFYFNKESILNLIGLCTSLYLPLITINLKLFDSSYKKNIYANKKSLWLWIIMYSTIICVTIFNKFICTIPTFMGLIIIILLFLPFSVGSLWGINLKSFNWNINFSMLLMIAIMFICWFIPQNLIPNTWNKTTLKVIYYMKPLTLIKNVLKTAIYPAFYEELVFRGILISGLLALKIEDWKINILQALIFGITHILANKQVQFDYTISASLCSIQFLMGYILGKIYFKTKSLFPCIIFHTILDTIYKTF